MFDFEACLNRLALWAASRTKCVEKMIKGSCDDTASYAKATAVWLIDNTGLTFEQIGAFCDLHPLEVQAIADGEIGTGMQGYDPITNNQLSKEEVARCEADPEAKLELSKSNLPQPTARTKGPRYVPVARRGDKPDAIAWLVKHHPELSDAQISRLIGTTKDTITKIRERTHWNISNIQAKHPLCWAYANSRTLTPQLKRLAGSQNRMLNRLLI